MSNMAFGAILGAVVALAATLLKDRAWHRNLAIYRCKSCGHSPQRLDKKSGRQVPNTMKVNSWQLAQLRKCVGQYPCPKCGGAQEIQLLEQ